MSVGLDVVEVVAVCCGGERHSGLAAVIVWLAVSAMAVGATIDLDVTILLGRARATDNALLLIEVVIGDVVVVVIVVICVVAEGSVDDIANLVSHPS